MLVLSCLDRHTNWQTFVDGPNDKRQKKIRLKALPEQYKLGISSWYNCSARDLFAGKLFCFFASFPCRNHITIARLWWRIGGAYI